MPTSSVDAYVSKLKPPHRELVEALRDLILQAAPDVEEAVKWGYPAYEKDGFVCAIHGQKEYVRLQLWRGRELADPAHRLEGTGKNMRPIKVQNLQDIHPALFTTWVQEAIALNEKHKRRSTTRSNPR